MASVRKREWEYKGVKKSAWEVRYLDQDGKHRSKQFDKKKEAEAYRSTVETEINSGMHAAEAQKKTVNFVADEFLKLMRQREKAGEIGKTYLRRIESDIRNKVSGSIGLMKLGEVKLSTLSDWYYRQIEGGMTPRTARIASHSVKMIFDYAMRRGWVVSNPVTQMLSETRGAPQKEIKTFTKAEIVHLLEVAKAPMYRGRRHRANASLQLFVNLAVFCGLRIGEIHGLKVENIDFDKRIVRIRSSLSRHDGLKGPKSKAGNRDIGMPSHITDLLTIWMERFHVKNDAGLVFTRPDGNPLDTSVYRGQWSRLLFRAGFTDDRTKPTYHFHALRHFAASWRVHEGVPLPIVAKEMGHSKVDMTLSIYTHALEHGTGTAEAAQLLSDKLISPSEMVIPPALAQELRTAS